MRENWNPGYGLGGVRCIHGSWDEILLGRIGHICALAL